MINLIIQKIKKILLFYQLQKQKWELIQFLLKKIVLVMKLIIMEIYKLQKNQLKILILLILILIILKIVVLIWKIKKKFIVLIGVKWVLEILIIKVKMILIKIKKIKIKI